MLAGSIVFDPEENSDAVMMAFGAADAYLADLESLMRTSPILARKLIRRTTDRVEAMVAKYCGPITNAEVNDLPETQVSHLASDTEDAQINDASFGSQEAEVKSRDDQPPPSETLSFPTNAQLKFAVLYLLNHLDPGGASLVQIAEFLLSIRLDPTNDGALRTRLITNLRTPACVLWPDGKQGGLIRISEGGVDELKRLEMCGRDRDLQEHERDALLPLLMEECNKFKSRGYPLVRKRKKGTAKR